MTARLSSLDVDLILAQCAGRVPRDLTKAERAEFTARQEATAQDARAIGLPEALAKPQQ